MPPSDYFVDNEDPHYDSKWGSITTGPISEGETITLHYWSVRNKNLTSRTGTVEHIEPEDRPEKWNGPEFPVLVLHEPDRDDRATLAFLGHCVVRSMNAEGETTHLGELVDIDTESEQADPLEAVYEPPGSGLRVSKSGEVNLYDEFGNRVPIPADEVWKVRARADRNGGSVAVEHPYDDLTGFATVSGMNRALGRLQLAEERVDGVGE